jgi:hypothetical protein
MLDMLFPPTSQYRVSYDTALKEDDFWYLHGNHFAHLSVIGGIIAAVEHELDKGLLDNRSRLVQAEIFADFLEMAEHLLDEGYKDAAAVLIGGVLEDTLRKLSESAGLPSTNNAGKALTIDPLNTQLAKAGVYEKLV